MVDTQLKQELHQLIDKYDNEFLLTEANELLKSTDDVKDCGMNLLKKIKNLLFESETEYEKEM